MQRVVREDTHQISLRAWQLIIALSLWLKFSTSPSVWGWYVVVFTLFMPMISQMLNINLTADLGLCLAKVLLEHHGSKSHFLLGDGQ